MERLGSPADMIMTARRKFALGAFAFAIACQGEALAQDGAKPKPLIPDKVIENEIARYCTNFVPLEAEARVAYQTRLLIELEAQVKQRISELDKQESDAREWVAKREAMLKSATEEVAAMYAKMPADAAAAQIGAMEDPVAVAILIKLTPRAAGGILGEMDADKAARLTSLIAWPAAPEKKS
jgi:flagellar motility protein MotE (MotC chaperone)